MLQATLCHNIVLPSLPYHHKKFGFLDTRWETNIAGEMTGTLRVKTPSIQTIIANLSGGNQQKVILAKWLIANSRILLLDEPTRGIDVNAKSEFYALMNDFVAQGGCIVMVSSELPEMLGVADRIIVMREGVQSGEISGAEATEHSIIQLASVQSNV
jgi:ABC-type sugar transport system ATPase subunit